MRHLYTGCLREPLNQLFGQSSTLRLKNLAKEAILSNPLCKQTDGTCLSPLRSSYHFRVDHLESVDLAVLVLLSNTLQAMDSPSHLYSCTLVTPVWCHMLECTRNFGHFSTSRMLL